MVVLADELLEQFFESSFPASFHMIDGLPAGGATPTSASSLTTFSGLGMGGSNRAGSSTATAGAGAAGPPVGAGRGLRGVLDNIVTDGMRVAAEVRRRMEEAQRELERNALPGQQQQQGQQRASNDEDEEYDEDDVPGASSSAGGAGAGAAAGAGKGSGGAYGGDAERRSVRSSDRDLLTGADAEAMQEGEGLMEEGGVAGVGGAQGEGGGRGATPGRVVGIEFDG
jgi:hypothetical protein